MHDYQSVISFYAQLVWQLLVLTVVHKGSLTMRFEVENVIDVAIVEFLILELYEWEISNSLVNR